MFSVSILMSHIESDDVFKHLEAMVSLENRHNCSNVFFFFFLKLWLWKDTLTHILIKHLARHKNTIEHNLNTGCLEIHVQHQHVSLLALCPSSYLLFRFVEKLLIYCKHGSFMRFTYSILHQTLKCGQLATFYIIFNNVFFSCWNQ